MYKRTSDVWLFDYRLNAWEHIKGKANGLSFTQWSEGASCYDLKRGRLYAFNENESSGIYDMKTNTWMKFGEGVQPNRLAKTKYMSTRTSAHYDVANDVVVVRMGNRFWVYEPAKDRWVSEKPITVHASGRHGFYDPKLNVHFFYDAGDSNFKPGVIRAWRYRRTR